MRLFRFSIIALLYTINISAIKSQTAADSISPTFPKVLFVNKSNEVLLYYDDRRQAFEVPSNGFIEGPIDFTAYIDSLANDIGIMIHHS